MPPRESRLRLTADLVSAKLLVWVASAGRGAELTADAHRFFADRYLRLARLHRQRGSGRRAAALEAKGRRHLDQAGDDGPPHAAAMAMPRPARFVVTDAVSRTPLRPPDDAA